MVKFCRFVVLLLFFCTFVSEIQGFTNSKEI